MPLPVEGGTQLEENLVGANLADYDFYLVLSRFKGHAMAGFGGAINTSLWGGDQDTFLESMGDAGKLVVDVLDGQIVYIAKALCSDPEQSGR